MIPSLIIKTLTCTLFSMKQFHSTCIFCLRRGFTPLKYFARAAVSHDPCIFSTPWYCSTCGLGHTMILCNPWIFLHCSFAWPVYFFLATVSRHLWIFSTLRFCSHVDFVSKAVSCNWRIAHNTVLCDPQILFTPQFRSTHRFCPCRCFTWPVDFAHAAVLHDLGIFNLPHFHVKRSKGVSLRMPHDISPLFWNCKSYSTVHFFCNSREIKPAFVQFFRSPFCIWNNTSFLLQYSTKAPIAQW